MLAAMNVRVLGRAETARAALALERAYEPDVVIVVVEDEDDAEVARQLHYLRPRDGSALVVCAVGASDAALRAAIELAAPAVVAPAPLAVRRRPSHVLNGDALTRREREVLRLASTGLSNSAIARTLWVSDETVKSHLASIYRKLGVRSRREAAQVALERGYLSADGVADDEWDAAQPPAKAAAMDKL